MKFLLCCLLTILSLLLVACEPSQDNMINVPSSPMDIVVTDTVTPTALTSTPELPPTETLLPPTPTQSPTAFPITARPSYSITAVLDYSWRTLDVKQEIIYPNPSNNSISELELVVQPNWRPDLFKLTHIMTGDGIQINNYTLEGIHLHALLSQPLLPGDNLHLLLAYEINIPPIQTSEDFQPVPFGYSSRQINLTDWYPFIPPYREGTGWIVHNPWYYGEHLVYPVADFEVNISITNSPDTTVIAASALDTGDNNLHRYQLVGARNFVWSASHEYKVLREQIGDTTVLSYSFPYDVAAGEAALRTTVEALTLYNSLFGPYSFKSMTIVEADFNQGMEYSGLYFLNNAFYGTYDGSNSSYLVTIAAHETAHQWWYGMVGNDQALEPWLDEALCTYSEKIFLENLYPEALSWWEDVRVNYYEPTGWIDSTIYNTIGYRAYRDAIYLNGARFLDDLRARVGEDVFFQFLKDYLVRYSDQIATKTDFFNVLRDRSRVEIIDLLTNYFQYP